MITRNTIENIGVQSILNLLYWVFRSLLPASNVSKFFYEIHANTRKKRTFAYEITKSKITKMKKKCLLVGRDIMKIYDYLIPKSEYFVFTQNVF